MKYWIPLGFLVCSSLIQLVSTARGSRTFRTYRSYRTYYNTGSTGRGRTGNTGTYIAIGCVLGGLALGGGIVGLIFCCQILKDRRARKKEEAKKPGGGHAKNMLQKRSKNVNVVGTT